VKERFVNASFVLSEARLKTAKTNRKEEWLIESEVQKPKHQLSVASAEHRRLETMDRDPEQK